MLPVLTGVADRAVSDSVARVVDFTPNFVSIVRNKVNTEWMKYVFQKYSTWAPH